MNDDNHICCCIPDPHPRTGEQRLMPGGKIPEVRFKGVRIDAVRLGNVAEIVDSALKSHRTGYICVNDVGNVVMAARNGRLRSAIDASLLSLADGMPLAWFARLAGHREIDRISGMDLMTLLFAAQPGYRHFLLGDTEERILRVTDKVRSLNPVIEITGYSPPFREFTPEDNCVMIEKITKEKPDLVWVSFGGGRQETWMHDMIAHLDRGIMIGIGAGFKWFIGELKTPPRIIQKMGLQWAYRIIPAILRHPQKNWTKASRQMRRKLAFMCFFPGEVLRVRRK